MINIKHLRSKEIFVICSFKYTYLLYLLPLFNFVASYRARDANIITPPLLYRFIWCIVNA